MLFALSPSEIGSRSVTRPLFIATDVCDFRQRVFAHPKQTSGEQVPAEEGDHRFYVANDFELSFWIWRDSSNDLCNVGKGDDAPRMIFKYNNAISLRNRLSRKGILHFQYAIQSKTARKQSVYAMTFVMDKLFYE